MAQMLCVNCDARMSNTSTPNQIEHFLINSWVGDSRQKEYDKVVARTNKTQREDPDGDGEIDTWFDVCLELGSDTWICPNCQTMHIFSKDGKTLDKVYKLVDKESWNLGSRC